MSIFLLCAVVLANAASMVFHGCYGKGKTSNGFLFTGMASLIACLFFICYNGFAFVFDRYTLMMSCFFALAYLTCMVSNLYALKRGSVAITSLILSFSLLLPTLFGIVYWKEATSLTFYIGLLLVACSIVLSNMKKQATTPRPADTAQHKASKLDPLWMLFVALAFVGNGGCSIVQTYHQKTGGAPFKAEFMIGALAIVCLCNWTIALCMLKKETGGYLKPALLYGGLYGVCNAFVNLGVMLLASGDVINQSVFFPIISIGSIVLVFVASLFLFKEKFRPIQYVGVALGIIAIVLLQL